MAFFLKVCVPAVWEAIGNRDNNNANQTAPRSTQQID